MLKIMKKIKKTHTIRQFAAMQIEISSRCNLKCTFCPCTYAASKGDLMDLELFKKLAPYFPWAKWVYLQGWGEPLLNPHVWEMAEIVRDSGSNVGFTTNGTMLTEHNIERIFACGIDLISVSIAGAVQETHRKLRKGSDLAMIVKQLLKIAYLKRKTGAKKPRVHLSYMLTNKNIKELQGALSLAAEVEADAFYTTNLDYVFNNTVNENKIFSWSDLPPEEYVAIITNCQEFAAKKDIPLRTYPLYLGEEQAVCDLNPECFVFITSQGNVVPCTYLSRDDQVKIFKDDKYGNYPQIFGNIKEEDFGHIWAKDKYQNFRKPFVIRERAYQELILRLTATEPSLAKVREAEGKYKDTLLNNPLPEECQRCPKKYGV